MASTAHTVENACRVVRADLDARQEDARTLKERCERAFAYCDNYEHRADAEALEVWCGAVGVTLDSTLAAKARIAPLLEAARRLRAGDGDGGVGGCISILPRLSTDHIAALAAALTPQASAVPAAHGAAPPTLDAQVSSSAFLDADDEEEDVDCKFPRWSQIFGVVSGDEPLTFAFTELDFSAFPTIAFSPDCSFILQFHIKIFSFVKLVF